MTVALMPYGARAVLWGLPMYVIWRMMAPTLDELLDVWADESRLEGDERDLWIDLGGEA